MERNRHDLAVARLRQAARALSGRLREADVAHVRDARLDHDGQAKANQPARGTCLSAKGQQLVVIGHLEQLVDAAVVVARVVDCTCRRVVRHLRRPHEVASHQLKMIEPKLAGRDRHRAL